MLKCREMEWKKFIIIIMGIFIIAQDSIHQLPVLESHKSEKQLQTSIVTLDFISGSSIILHDDRNMVVHVLANVSQEARGNDTDSAKRDAHVVDVLVRLSVSDLAGRNHQLVCTRNAANAGDGVEFLEQRCAGQLDGLFDERQVCDVEFNHHGAADVVDGGHFELGDEDVVAMAMSVFCDVCMGFVMG